MKNLVIFFLVFYSQSYLLAQNMGVKLPVSTLPNTTLDVNGSAALREGSALTLANGVNSDVVLSDYSLFRITGPTLGFSITGFTGGQNGRVLTLINATSQILSFTNASTSLAANQINTGGSALNLAANGVATLIYNSTLAQWVVTGGQGFTNNWALTGNSGTSATTNFIGTTDGQPLVFKTNDNEAMRLSTGGNLGIGANIFTDKLHSTAGSITNSFGGYFNGTAGLTTNYGLFSTVGNTATNNYMYYGTITAGGNTDWGIYLTGEEKNYFSGNVGIGQTNPNALLHLWGIGKSGFMPTSWGGTSNGPEIAFSSGGIFKPGATIQMIDYNSYSTGLAFNVHKGTNYGGGGTFADNWPTDVVQAMTIDNQGNIGIGTGTPKTKMDVDGGLTIRPTTTVNLTADNQVVTVGNLSFLVLSSDNATAANRTFTLSSGYQNGHILVILVTLNAAELVDGGNCALSSTFGLGTNDTLSLIWNGSSWYETGRSNN
jgi:hypothetical protein